MTLTADTIAKLAAAGNVTAEYAQAWTEAFAATAAKLVAAGEMTLDNLDLPLVHEVMQARLERLFDDNFEAIATEVWERANAAA